MKEYPEWVLRRWVEGSYFMNRQPGKMLRLKEFELYSEHEHYTSIFPFDWDVAESIKRTDPELLKYLYRGYCKPCEFCGNPKAVRKRQRTNYCDDKENFANACTACHEINDEHWDVMWDEYYSGCL